MSEAKWTMMTPPGGPTEPDDPWTLVTPRDEATLAALRREVVEEVADTMGMSDAVRATATFTCDDCERRFKCTLAFDPYNVAGDCLWEK